MNNKEFIEKLEDLNSQYKKCITGTMSIKEKAFIDGHINMINGLVNILRKDPIVSSLTVPDIRKKAIEYADNQVKALPEGESKETFKQYSKTDFIEGANFVLLYLE